MKQAEGEKKNDGKKEKHRKKMETRKASRWSQNKPI